MKVCWYCWVCRIFCIISCCFRQKRECLNMRLLWLLCSDLFNCALSWCTWGCILYMGFSGRSEEMDVLCRSLIFCVTLSWNVFMVDIFSLRMSKLTSWRRITVSPVNFICIGEFWYSRPALYLFAPKRECEPCPGWGKYGTTSQKYQREWDRS